MSVKIGVMIILSAVFAQLFFIGNAYAYDPSTDKGVLKTQELLDKYGFANVTLLKIDDSVKQATPDYMLLVTDDSTKSVRLSYIDYFNVSDDEKNRYKANLQYLWSKYPVKFEETKYKNVTVNYISFDSSITQSSITDDDLKMLVELDSMINESMVNNINVIETNGIAPMWGGIPLHRGLTKDACNKWDFPNSDWVEICSETPDSWPPYIPEDLIETNYSDFITEVIHSYEHWYNPEFHLGGAADACDDMGYYAYTYYQNNDPYHAGEYLGYSSHYIGDVGCPLHTGAEISQIGQLPESRDYWVHFLYENYGAFNWGTYRDPSYTNDFIYYNMPFKGAVEHQFNIEWGTPYQLTVDLADTTHLYSDTIFNTIYNNRFDPNHNFKYDMNLATLTYLSFGETASHMLGLVGLVKGTTPSYTITLNPGLNLISMPLVSGDNNVYNAFPSDVENSISIIWGYDPNDPSDPWRTWVPMGPYGNGDLETIDVDHGYIVVLNGYTPKSFNVYGLKPDYVVPSSSLYNGKNFVGYPSSNVRSISDVYNQATIVWAYDNTPPGQWINYVPNMPGNDLTQLEPGHGYVVCKNYAYSSSLSTNSLTLVDESDPISLPIPDASVISYNIPDVMVPGQSYDVSITFNNTGTWAWSEEDCIRLCGVGDSLGDAAKFSDIRFYIPNGITVTPGNHYTWNFTMTAPLTPGVYNPQYQILWEGYESFGEILSKNIIVGLPGYSYMKVHNITGSVDGALTNYQVMFTIHNGSGIDSGEHIYLNGHSLNWPNDIRFTNNLVTPLSYWIESYNSTVATVWVKVDSIAASPAVTPINVYYGKSGDVSQSNGSTTFRFFDDFSGSSLDWSKWSRDNGAGSTAFFNVANGALSFGVTSYRGEVLRTIPTFGDHTAVSVRMKTISPTLDRTAYSNYYPVYNTWTWPADRAGRQDRYWYANNILGTYTISPQTYFIQDACVDGTSLRFNTNGGSWVSTNNYTPQAAPVQFNANWANSGFVVDWIFVRNYTVNEPIQPTGMMRASISTNGLEVVLPINLSQDRNESINNTTISSGSDLTLKGSETLI